VAREPSADIDTVITAAGDLVVPAEVVRQVSGGTRTDRSSAGVPDVTADEVADERREVWGDLADDQ
jgi:hypothetical protein